MVIDLSKWEKIPERPNYTLDVNDEWYLSYNDSHINCDNEPELAIVSRSRKDMGILYGTNPNEFENFQNIDEALEYGSKLVAEGRARNGFWTGYDFESKRWYNDKEVTE